MALLVGPVVALLGLLCLYYVMRSRAKTRTSLYTARRTLLHARAAERRDRALSGTMAGALPAVAPGPPVSPVQATAEAATVAPPEAVAPPPAAPMPPAEQPWEQSPTRPQPMPPPPPVPLEAQPPGPVPDQPVEAGPPAAPPAPEPLPPPPAPLEPQPIPYPAMPAAAPAAPTDWPASTAPVEPPPAAPPLPPFEEQVPIEPSMPAAEAPWEVVPNPTEAPFGAPPAEPPGYEPAAAEAMPEPGQAVPEPMPVEASAPAAGWSIVGAGGEEISADTVAVPGRGDAKAEPKKEQRRAPWDIVPHARGKHEEVNLLMGEEPPKETVGMTLLSYAGLVGALVVVLLGVLLMVATTR